MPELEEDELGNGQKALLTFRAPDGRLWLAAAILTPLQSISGGEERWYNESDGMRLKAFKIVYGEERS